MPPPSQLSIATSSLQRLVREESSYHQELKMQQQSIDRLEASLHGPNGRKAGNNNDEAGNDDDGDDERGNQEFLLRQQKKAIEETEVVFPKLRERIADAIANLEGLLGSVGEADGDSAKAREVVEEAKRAMGLR